MKKVARKASAPKTVSPSGRKTGRASAVRRARTGSNGHRAKRPTPISYDAEDIEEANRLDAAICRQHAL